MLPKKSLKLKNESLLDSIDKLTAENEALKRRMENREDIHAKLSEKNDELERLRMEIDTHKRQVDELSKEVKKCKENEMLLLKYPDLYGPIEQHGDENELNVCEDMINQINANKYRIGLLENLNKKLSNSIKKLNETQVVNSKASETDNYFMKQRANPNDSTRTLTPLRQSSSSKIVQDKHEQANERSSATSAHIMPVRPVPLFKLENELVPTNEHSNQNELKYELHIFKYKQKKNLHDIYYVNYCNFQVTI